MRAMSSERKAPGSYAENPVLARVWRGEHVESVHRGAWVLTDACGRVIDGAGEWGESFYARSAVKSLQALPLLETGAADRFGFGTADLALALASHSAEACHTDVVRGILARLDLDVSALRCGAHPPNDPGARRELAQSGERPTALHNNCSGKHAGFLALARHLGEDPAAYLDPDSRTQRLVREAVLEVCELEPDQVAVATDGCSAPTFRLPLVSLAAAFARIANPGSLGAVRRRHCERMTDAVAQHPELIAGRHKRPCTTIASATRGRLFPKVGAEAVYAVGVVGGSRGLAIKIDDGAWRGLYAVLPGLLEKLGLATPEELAGLEEWRGRPLRNHAGLDVGRIEVCA